MKFFFVLFLLIFFRLRCTECQEKEENIVAVAINEYIKNHFVEKSIKFNFIINSNDVVPLDKVLKGIKGIDSYKIFHLNDEKLGPLRLEQSTVFIFTSFESFLKVEDFLDFHLDGPKQIEYLIYCPNLTSEIIEQNLPGDQFNVRSYLVVENGDVYLKTLKLFTASRCNKQQLVQLNKFSRKSMKWSTNQFFETIIKDFFGCQLKIGIARSHLPASDYQLKEDNTHASHGYLINMLLSLSPHLNFKIFTKPFGVESQDERFDMTTLTSIVDGNSYKQNAIVLLFLESFMGIVIPPGEAYTEYEKLLLPFEETVWIYFGLTFFTSFSVIIIVKYCSSKSVQHLIFGKGISSPGLNIIVAFMGSGQMMLPKRIFPRFLLMIFILFSLVMR